MKDEAPKLSLDKIIERHGAWIRARLRRRFPGEWEDLFQEVMMKVDQGLAHFDGGEGPALRSWLSRITRSVSVDEFRRSTRRPVTEGESKEATHSGPSAADLLLRDEAKDELRALARQLLSAREREILHLRFHAGLSFRQIAQILNVPQGSVAGWYSRAILRLREAWK